MNTVFILVNQNYMLLEKSGNWGYGNDLRALYRTQLRDEAINQKVELTVKDPELRVKIESVELDEKGQPALSDELIANIPPRPVEDIAPQEQGAASAEPMPEQATDNQPQVQSA